jgi:hypothetical protein
MFQATLSTLFVSYASPAKDLADILKKFRGSASGGRAIHRVCLKGIGSQTQNRQPWSNYPDRNNDVVLLVKRHGVTDQQQIKRLGLDVNQRFLTWISFYDFIAGSP